MPGQFSKEVLLKWKPFAEWIETLKASLKLQYRDTKPLHPFHDDPYVLRKIHIQAVDYFGPRPGFIKLDAVLQSANKGKPLTLPGKIFMRGGSVAMLMILRPEDSRDERLVIMTEQARIPAGSLAFLEIPAGMIDDAKTFSGAAAKEIEEETGMKIPTSELIDMTKLAMEDSPNPENLAQAMYPSPGGSDEFIALFLWEKKMERLEIEALKEKLTGDRLQGEMIKLRLINYEDLWKLAARDGKTMVAWALYESLKRAGKLDDDGNIVGDASGPAAG
ncbi:putative NUDIX family hydrolase [Halenospora varia]|nr:putative NUDIX family hydrolase [Halenospora varia]